MSGDYGPYGDSALRSSACPSDSAADNTSGTVASGGGGGGSHAPGNATPPSDFTLRVNLAACKYPVLWQVARKLGWEVAEGAEESAHLYWTDTSAGCEPLARLLAPQRLNHFPGMLEIARKKGLARNLGHMRALFPQHYDFTPRTFLLPEELPQLLAELGGAARGCSASGGKGSEMRNGGCSSSTMRIQSSSSGAHSARGGSAHSNRGDACSSGGSSAPGGSSNKSSNSSSSGSGCSETMQQQLQEGRPEQQQGAAGGQQPADEVRRQRTTRKTFILKLDNGSQGRGIKLVQSAAGVLAALPTFKHENLVACQYIPNPLLIEGFKFDLRLYVLVRCVDPPRAFLHREGLVRLCTAPYQPPTAANLGDAFRHLTNYAVNKQNPEFQFNKDAQQDGQGSKWSLTAFAEWMQAQGHDFEALWAEVQQLVARTLISIQPSLQYNYRATTRADDEGLTCFELLGLDVLVDDTLRPWLLEVNHSPSLSTDTPLDLAIKERLITQTLALVGVDAERVRQEEEARSQAHQERLYGGHAACVAHAAPPASAPAAAAEQAASCSCNSGGRGSSSSTSAATGGGMPGSLGCRPAQAAGAVQAGPAPTAEGSKAQQQKRQQRGRQQQEAQLQQQQQAQQQQQQQQQAEEAPGWEATQRAHEDAHMGLFERVLPSPDPDLQALYEELLHGARKVFFRQTMQGRNAAKIMQMQERRHQEAAEAAAQEEAQRRRVEGLKAWMASLCQRHRQERSLLEAAAQQAQHAEQAQQQAQQQAQEQQQQQGVGHQGFGWDEPSAGGLAPVASAHFASAQLALPQRLGSTTTQQQQQQSGVPCRLSTAGSRGRASCSGQGSDQGSGCAPPGLSILGASMGRGPGCTATSTPRHPGSASNSSSSRPTTTPPCATVEDALAAHAVQQAQLAQAGRQVEGVPHGRQAAAAGQAMREPPLGGPPAAARAAAAAAAAAPGSGWQRSGRFLQRVATFSERYGQYTAQSALDALHAEAGQGSTPPAAPAACHLEQQQQQQQQQQRQQQQRQRQQQEPAACTSGATVALPPPQQLRQHIAPPCHVPPALLQGPPHASAMLPSTRQASAKAPGGCRQRQRQQQQQSAGLSGRAGGAAAPRACSGSWGLSGGTPRGMQRRYLALIEDQAVQSVAEMIAGVLAGNRV